MHGTEHCNRSAGRFASPLPDHRFRRPPDQCFKARRKLSPDRGRMLVTAFRSPATAAAFTASIPGSMFLACYFASLPIASAARSAFRSATDPGLPRIGRLNASDPLQLPRPARPAASPASTPLRDCYIPPDQSVPPDLLPAQPAFRFRPISVRSPPPVSITSCGCGSTFPVRYVFGGLLFLKPLGTFFTMLPIALLRQDFLCDFSLFSSICFSLCF